MGVHSVMYGKQMHFARLKPHDIPHTLSECGVRQDCPDLESDPHLCMRCCPAEFARQVLAKTRTVEAVFCIHKVVAIHT
jgi:hypothetical protein